VGAGTRSRRASGILLRAPLKVFKVIKMRFRSGMVAHTWNPSTQQAEARGSGIRGEKEKKKQRVEGRGRVSF
jgi:hypothetical protein